jgi:tRNA G18 (ribose-2'-O)-methylase SpoU
MRVCVVTDLNVAELAPYRDVRHARALQVQGLFVAEGRWLVERVIDAAAGDVISLLLSGTAERALKARLVALSDQVTLWSCSDVDMASLTGVQFHQGCLALVRRPPPLDEREVFERASLALVLEGVGNPDNLGAVMRSAQAFGVQAVLLGPGCADPYSRKALRSSMGSALHVPHVSCADASRFFNFIDELGRGGWARLALTPGGCALLEQRQLRRGERCALFVGAEGPGLSEIALAHCSERLRISMAQGIDSLNLGVATGIALHWLSRAADH